MASRKPRAKPKPPNRPPVDAVNTERLPQVSRADRFRAVRSLVFFGFFYLYFAVGIDVRLLYHGCGWVDNFPCFYRGWGFFQSFLSRPGGIIEYLAAWLAQSFYYSWLGAAVVTAQAWGLWACTGLLLKAFGADRLRGLRYVVPLALIGLYCRYSFPFVPTTALLAALLGACLYLRLDAKTNGGAIGTFVALCLILYIAAAGAVLVFAVVCGLHEVLVKRRGGPALAQLAVGMAMPYVVGGLIYGVRILDAYCRLTPMSWELLSRNSFRGVAKPVCGLFLFVPATAAILGIMGLVTARRNSSKPPGGRLKLPLWTQSLRANLPTVALVASTAGVVLFCRTPARKNTLLADYFSRQGMWDQVLALGRRSPYQYTVCHAVDRALCHLDRLGDEMFEFPQHPTALLLTDPAVEPLWQKFDTCLDLGLVNQAENSLVLCTEIYGERPLLLHRLATINMIKGNLGAARVYLRSLAKVPFWKATADRDLARLDGDPGLSEDPEIRHYRSVMLKEDSVQNIDTLNVLLTENAANRTAYQYGVAFMLFSKDLNGFARLFNTYHQRNFTRVPRLYEQAIAVAQMVGTWPADAPAPTVSPQAKAQLDEFLQAFRGASGVAAQTSLRARFGDTYFYYYFAGRPGESR